MANGILKQLNQSLEITVQDGLDGLADFTLQLAYATTNVRIEVVAIDDCTPKSSLLKLVDTLTTDTTPQPKVRRQQRC